MTGSGSDSGSFSSSRAIIAHFDEFSLILQERGFQVSDRAINSVSRAIRDEVLQSVEFSGVDERGNAHTYTVIEIDWKRHAILVNSGDAVHLPVGVDGEPVLKRIRRLAEHFMDFYRSLDLASEVRFRYTPEARGRAKELNAKYGWRPALPVPKVGEGFAAEDYTSDYHEAVTIKQWFAD